MHRSSLQTPCRSGAGPTSTEKTAKPSAAQPKPVRNLPDIPAPSLNQCHPKGHGQALYLYDRDVTDGMIRIDSGLQEQALMPYKMCRLLVGQFRQNCCNQVKAAAIQRCQQGVDAFTQSDTKCWFKAPCRRKALCPIKWIVEEKRVQCCNGLKPQGIRFLKGYCASRLETMTVTCAATNLPSVPTPIGQVNTPTESDGYVTIQPVGTPIPFNPGLSIPQGESPERVEDGTASAE